MKADVIVLTYGNEDMTCRCFRSLRKHTNGYRLIWVDNGSGKKSIDTVLPEARANPGMVPIWLPENVGFVKGTNIALKVLLEVFKTDADYIVMVNNDVEVTEGWLDRMRRVFERDLKVRAVGPVTSECKSWQSYIHARKMLPVFQIPAGFERLGTGERARKLDYAYGELAAKCNMLAFFCTAFKREVFEKLGYLDERFGIGYGDDDDLCYDEQTQVVTRAGIKFMRDVFMEDEILTMSDDEVMGWEYPTRVVSREEDELLHFKTRRLDLMVSKDQDLLVGYRYPSKKIEKPLTFMRASEVNNRLWPGQGRYYVKKNGGIWEGEDRPMTEIKGVKFDTFWLVRFLGWYLSEGHCEKRCASLKITQWKEDYKEDIRKTLGSLGLDYTEIEQGFYIKAGSGLYEFCKSFGKAHEKRVPEMVKSLPPRYLVSFLESYRMGDGTDRGKGGESYVTSSDAMRDDLVEILLKVGRTFSIGKSKGGKQKFSNGEYECRPCWQIQSYRMNQERALLQPAEVVEYNGTTYDLTVPSRRIYVIRNGKGCWSSNCKRMRDARMELAVSLGTYVFHNHQSTFKKMFSDDEIEELKKKRLQTYKDKHGEDAVI